MILNCRNVSKVTFQNSENKGNIFSQKYDTKFKSGKKDFEFCKLLRDTFRIEDVKHKYRIKMAVEATRRKKILNGRC